METDSLRILRARRADLWSRLEDARAQIKAQEAEIKQIDLGIKAMEAENIMPITGVDASLRSVAHHARQAHPDIQKMTLKQLVVKALKEHFQNGATANQLLDLFERKWGRQIMRTSLSPQLSRLKNDNIIELEGKTWHLSKPVKAFGVPGLFPDENGEAEASPEASPNDGTNVVEGSDKPIAPPASTS
tara:strand:+ start:179 stop:742 length:564 start_codon:yes stop_codon:yes gene_type:complete